MISSFRSPSLIAALAGGLIIIYSLFNISPWKSHKVIQGDVCGYYAFLPAYFIYNDQEYNFDESLTEKYGNVVWVITTENGYRTPKYTVGLAFMNLPAFLLANVIATPLGYPADGYSLPYQMAIALSGGIYVFLGLLFLRLLLLKYFEEWVSALAIITVLLTTNLYYYSTTESGMSHAYSFFLFAAFLHYSLHWLESTSTKNTLLTGFFAGMILLVRPTNGLIFMVPLLYGISTPAGIGDKFRFISAHIGKVLIIAAITITISITQIIYWKLVTDNWLLYSYGEEQFYFGHPHFFKGLFGFRKGWLIYTPIMVLALTGIFRLRKSQPALFLPALIFTTLNLYVIFSWWCWWYGGSYGCRPVIESYALLALPLASLYEYMIDSRKWIFISLLFGFTSLSLFQSIQKRRNIIHFDSMTGEVYGKTFGKLNFPADYWNLLQKPDYESAMKGEKEKLNTRILEISNYKHLSFDDSLTAFSDSMAFNSSFSTKLNKDQSFSPIISVPFEDFPDSPHKIKVRATAYFYCLNKESELLLLIEFHRGNKPAYQQFQRHINYNKVKENDWNYLFLDAEIPDYFIPGDVVKIYLFNPKEKDILIDEFGVDFLEVEKY